MRLTIAPGWCTGRRSRRSVMPPVSALRASSAASAQMRTPPAPNVGRGPGAVQRHQPQPGALQPAQHALGLLGGRGRGRADAGRHHLGRGDQRVGERPRVLVAAGHAGRGQPAAPHDHDLPAAVVGQPGGHHLGARGERGQPLHPGGSPHEGGQPVAVQRRLLEPLDLGQPLDLAGQRGDQRAYVAEHRLPDGLGVHGVGLDRLGAVARRPAAAHLGQRAGRAGAPQRDALGALPQPERLVHRRRRELHLPRRGERAEVGRAVVAHLAHPRQPRERLGGQLEPHRPLGEAGPPVVARACAARSAAARAPRPRAASRTPPGAPRPPARPSRPSGPGSRPR